jgi:hypothetical protein
MRAVLVFIVMAGCAGSMRPAVMPKLSTLPGEPEVEPRPEQARVIRAAIPAALDLDLEQAQPPIYDQSLVPWVKLK